MWLVSLEKGGVCTQGLTRRKGNVRRQGAASAYKDGHLQAEATGREQISEAIGPADALTADL